MYTTSLEAFLTDLAFQLDCVYRDLMTPIETRIANTLVACGYGTWTDDGEFRKVTQAPAPLPLPPLPVNPVAPTGRKGRALGWGRT